MRKFLIAEVWGSYNELATLEKRAAREQMGDTFNDAFLDKETRSYDSINTDTLAMWARTLGAQQLPGAIPQTQQMTLNMPEQPQVQAVEGYYQQRDGRFPGISDLLDRYYDIPEGPQRDAFNKQYPQLDDYYKWRNQFFASNPAAIEPLQSESSDLYGLPVQIQHGVYQYRAQRDQMFPDIFETQDQYFADEDKTRRRNFLKSHPELPAYWTWRREYAAQNVQVAPYIMSGESLAKAITGESGGSSYSGGGSSGFSDEWGKMNIARGQLFPQWRVMQNEYYRLKDENPQAARDFLNQTPQLKEYWDWKRTYIAQHPGAASYSSPTASAAVDDRKAQDFAGFSFDPSQLPPMLIQAMMIYQYTGQKPGSGALQSLQYYWEQAGRPGGDINTFIEGYVQPSLAAR